MEKKETARRGGGRRGGGELRCAVCGAKYTERMSLCRKCGFPLTDRRGLGERMNLYRRVQVLELQNQKLFAALAKHIRETEGPSIPFEKVLDEGVGGGEL